jgi:hypothetical protein
MREWHQSRRAVPVGAVVVLLAAACSPTGSVTLHPETGSAARAVEAGVQYEATTESLAGDSLRTSITLTNTSAEPVDLAVPGGCTVLVRAYADEARTGPVAWDQSADIICTMELRLVRLEPGASETFHSPSYTAGDMRAAGVPSGRFYLTGVINPENTRIELAAGAIEL